MDHPVLLQPQQRNDGEQRVLVHRAVQQHAAKPRRVGIDVLGDQMVQPAGADRRRLRKPRLRTGQDMVADQPILPVGQIPGEPRVIGRRQPSAAQKANKRLLAPQHARCVRAGLGQGVEDVSRVRPLDRPACGDRMASGLLRRPHLCPQRGHQLGPRRMARRGRAKQRIGRVEVEGEAQPVRRVPQVALLAPQQDGPFDHPPGADEIEPMLHRQIAQPQHQHWRLILRHHARQQGYGLGKPPGRGQDARLRRGQHAGAEALPPGAGRNHLARQIGPSAADQFLDGMEHLVVVGQPPGRARQLLQQPGLARAHPGRDAAQKEPRRVRDKGFDQLQLAACGAELARRAFRVGQPVERHDQRPVLLDELRPVRRGLLIVLRADGSA